MVTAHDSEYDEKVYRIVAPEGTPLWLRVTKDPEASAEVPGFVEARMPPAGPVWQEIPRDYFDDDKEYYDRVHAQYGAVMIRQLTGAKDPKYPQSDPIQNMLNAYETAASFIVGAPGRFGSFTGTMMFDKRATPRAYELVTIVYENSTVWVTDLDKGPVRICTLWDLIGLGATPIKDFAKYGPSVAFARVGWIEAGKGKKKKKLWLLSEDQWNTATYPPESQGGPPYIKGVSVARDGRVRR